MGQRQVLVEMRIPRGAPLQDVRKLASQLSDYGFDWDPDYVIPMETVPVGAKGKRKRGYRSVILRGRIEEGREPELEARSDVIRVWSDAPIAPFTPAAEEAEEEKTDRPRKSPFAF
jgi:hypothetical protein